MTAKERTQLKMFWFARWLAMCYADSPAFNTETGDWYANQLGHFNRIVWPKWLKAAKKSGELQLSLDCIKKNA